jgi:hypothetical protein
MRNRGIRITAIAPSSTSEVTITVRSSEPTSPSRVVLVSDVTSRRWVSPMRRDTARPRIEARVITPRAPIWMPTRIVTSPAVDQ